MSETYFQEDEIVGKIYDSRLINRLLPYLKPYLLPMILAISCVILGMGMFLVNPYILGRVVDLGIKPKDMDTIKRLAYVYGGIEVFVFLFAYCQNYLLQYVGQKVMFDIRTQLFAHLQRLPVSFFDKNPVGRLVTRTTNDVAALSELFSAGIVVVIGDIFVILGIATTLVFLQPVLGIATLSTIPMLILAAYYFQSRFRTAYRNARAAIARVNASLSESISGIKVIQIFNRQVEREIKFDALNSNHRECQLVSIFYHALFTPIMTVINALTIAIILLLGGSMVLDGKVSIGVLVSFLAYAQHFFYPIRDISEKVSVFQSAMASAERVFGLLDEKEEVGLVEGKTLAGVKGKIEFKSVNFSYVQNRPVLKNLSFTVYSGESVAIVGHTGAGKTTIASLLNRFYDFQDGEILIDEVDIRTIAKKFLRGCTGVIQQDVFIFSGNVLENIRLWNDRISLEAVEKIADEVDAGEFIRNLPGGFESEIYERGANLSGGQRQLLSFARALCADPKILILDEATSSVDTGTEKIIQKAISKLINGRTCLIIAHRLSTIRHCDRILVLHKGVLVEAGTHEELLTRKGYYHKLHEIQFKEEENHLARSDNRRFV